METAYHIRENAEDYKVCLYFTKLPIILPYTETAKGTVAFHRSYQGKRTETETIG